MSIQINSLSYSYNKGLPNEIKALNCINLTIEPGEILSIAGKSGSGKSTLVKHINGLITPQYGSVTVDGITAGENKTGLRKLREKVGLVFQYPEDQIFAESVKEEISFAPRNFGFSKEEITKKVYSAMEVLGLDREILERNPFTFSGGYKRKIAIASILAYSPSYLILDEPTAGMDGEALREVAAVLKSEKKKGRGIIHITHDIELALETSDRIAVMDKGAIVFCGTPAEAMEFLCSDKNNIIDIPDVLKISADLRKKKIIKELTHLPDKLAEMLGEKQ